MVQKGRDFVDQSVCYPGLKWGAECPALRGDYRGVAGLVPQDVVRVSGDEASSRRLLEGCICRSRDGSAQQRLSERRGDTSVGRGGVTACRSTVTESSEESNQ